MNSITSIGRILEIYPIELSQDSHPSIRFDVQLFQIRKSNSKQPRNWGYRITVIAYVWGDQAYNLERNYSVNDYLIIEGYFSLYYEKSIDFPLFNSKLRSNYQFIELNVCQFYQYFKKF